MHTYTIMTLKWLIQLQLVNEQTQERCWSDDGKLIYPVYTMKQTWRKHEANTRRARVFSIRSLHFCFMFASSCKRGIIVDLWYKVHALKQIRNRYKTICTASDKSCDNLENWFSHIL